ncbi:MAG: aldo/keto reductase [Emergencia sp.]|jgi:predicted aldo/keto reductase-like oxidoreductase|uniref:aldo/keto reductase n=1 Tax=Anaerovoracaceae TaxID=543314 RepID=UPI00203C5AC8|nr:aldo/keto reductase [Senimuribacter intestinalis]MCI9638559.1 aldo/keto reductase [Emergencia sp.]
MTQIRLGKTEIITNKNGFGALPIQRISYEEADALIMKAYEAGITFFDTARFYTDSEAKLGKALSERGLRQKVYIASKTMCNSTEEFWSQLETTLTNLQTDYLDLYQFHNPAFCPKPGDGTGLYEAMLEAKAQGKVRHIGITNHRLAVAHEAIESGLYETLQFPFSYLASKEEVQLVEKCKEADMGFIAMKAMGGGLITRADASYAFCAQYENVLPIWGVQRQEELQQFLDCEKNPPQMDAAMKDFIAQERAELAGDFCRGCGYCMPCPAGIKINDCARMSLMIRRAPTGIYMDQAHQEDMEQIAECLHCNQCKERCPYGLDTPALLEKNLKDYREQLKK